MQSNNQRHPRGIISSFTVNAIHLRNPNTVMWWSAALPGFGHIMLCKYLLGSVLILWEFIINTNSHLNSAIIYSFTGRFELAIDVLDVRWAMLYIPIYFFAMWDSRRIAIDLNKFSILADRSGSTLQPIVITSLEINYLDKRRPLSAIVWSILCPGLGHIYINRIFTGFYALSCFVICIYFSNSLTSIFHFVSGDMKQSIEAINGEWFLFFPSLYGFSINDAYINTIEYNRLFKREQAQYLEKTYQSSQYHLQGIFRKE